MKASPQIKRGGYRHSKETIELMKIKNAITVRKKRIRKKLKENAQDALEIERLEKQLQEFVAVRHLRSLDPGKVFHT